jgi:ABC-type nickel/cobalt efflux system permease component RcnA/Tol biopolymer transport system component
MYAQSQAIQISIDGLLIDWKITPGPMLAFAAWDQADQKHDGQIRPEEAQSWLMPFISQWVVSLDGQTITDVQIQDLHWPASPDVLQSGEDPIEIHLVVKWPGSLTGQHLVEIHNANQEAISLNWFSLAAAGGISFSNPAQTNGRLDMNVNFGGTSGAIPSAGTSTLTSWDSGRPNLSGMTGALANMAGTLANPGNTQQPATGLSGPTAALVGLVRTQNFSLLFLAGAFLLSLALGSLHALTPGHGKTLVAAYLVGSHGRTRDAVFLGSIVTLTHTGSVLIFGLLTMLASRYIFPTLITPWLEIISGLTVVIFGLGLFLSRGRALYTWYESERAKKYASHFRGLRMAVSAHGISEDQPHRYILASSSHQHDGPYHEHSHPETHHHGEPDHEHTHSHALTADQVSWKSLLTLGISGGLVPCPDAIAILVVAVALGRIPLGMLLIVAFSLGLALVLIGIGIAMVQGVRFIKRNDLLNRFSLYTPIISAVVVSGLGIGLSLSALNSLKLSSAALHGNALASSSAISQGKPFGQVFDIKKARLVYLSQDSQDEDQLTVVPLAGGNPVVLTQEPAGVQGYSISPDGKTIFYSVLQMNGASSIWSINLDGSQKRLVLDCPQAQCDLPVWYPDGGNVVYERHDYSQSTPSPMFTIWWLDLATGETKPVFQDQAFPAVAPAFSPDGQWLSFVSPATNTIQVYNLLQGKTISIPLSNQSYADELWSPVGDSILYWDPATSQLDSAVHVKRYLLASGQKTDLGGSPQQADYLTAWSPDGQWIAIIRDGPNTGSPNIEEQIWLERPDGSQGHALLDDQGSYSDLSWSPDGDYLVYNRVAPQGNGNAEIWLADIRSGQLTKILVGGVTPALVP